MSDKKFGVSSGGSLIDYYVPDIVNATDYYPFGMPSRVSLTGKGYRFGFNGKENDNDVKGFGNQIDYGARVYDPRIGRFLSVDPITRDYPWYTPYQYAGNKPIRFVDLDGLEEANPSLFRKALNYINGDIQNNRLDEYLTQNNLTSDNVIQLANDTYVVIRISENAGTVNTYYSVFRSSRSGKTGWASFHRGAEDDDIDLTEEQFLRTKVIGEKVIQWSGGVGAGKSVAGVVLNGGKNAIATWRSVVGTVQKASKELVDWKKAIRFGVLDAAGVSRDLLKKGFHMHFSKLKNLELSLQYAEDAQKNGKIVLGYLTGEKAFIGEAIKTFNQAFANKMFQKQLLTRLKAAQETLEGAAKVLGNSDEVKMALDRAAEIGKMIKVLTK